MTRDNHCPGTGKPCHLAKHDLGGHIWKCSSCFVTWPLNNQQQFIAPPHWASLPW